MSTHQYTILRIAPGGMHGERLNIGIAVFTETEVSLHIEPSPGRLESLDPFLLPVKLHDWTAEAAKALSRLDSNQERHRWLMNACDPIAADEQLGTFHAGSTDEAEENIRQIMQLLAIPPGDGIKTSATTGTTPKKLKSVLLDWFRSAHILSRDVTNLSRHKVVPHYPVRASSGLYAEFACQKDAICIIETLDMRRHSKMSLAIQKDAAFKSIVFDQAKQVFDPAPRNIAVVAAADYGAMGSAINMVSSYADDVIIMDSAEDKARFADFLEKTLGKDGGMPPL